MQENGKYVVKRAPTLIYRAVRQMRKAVCRGDLNAALQWIIIAELQLDILERLQGVNVKHPRLWRYRDKVVAALEEAGLIARPNSSSELAGGEG
jgi:hypothetical protein